MEKNSKGNLLKNNVTIKSFFKTQPDNYNSEEEFDEQKPTEVKKKTPIKENISKKRKINEGKHISPQKKVREEMTSNKQSKDASNILVELNSSFNLPKYPLKIQACYESQNEKLNAFTPENSSAPVPTSHGKEMETDISLLSVEFDNWDEDFMEIPEDFNLDLTQLHHCKIVNISLSQLKITLTLISNKFKHKGLCILEGFWIYTHLEKGSNIYITAKNINNSWVINNEHGLLIFEPDILISPTSIVKSLWCKRKSLFSDRFAGFDSSNKPMLVGSLVHNTFQSALRNNISDITKLEELARQFIKDQRIIKILYECNLTLKIIEDEVFSYIPKIKEFLKYYVNSNNSEPLHQNDWKGIIDTIDDIEERIWCPELGVKGKIDVTVKSKLQIMPLELKTGKATMSLEHRGQILIYIMMMKKLGYNVSLGLLLYLKDGVVKEVRSSEKEERDILKLRNEMVYYGNKSPIINKDNNILPPELPDTIDHPSCSNCGYSNICSVYSHVANTDLTSKKHLKKIKRETLEYISQSHIDYFIKWTNLIIIESKKSYHKKDAKEIYLIPAEEREQSGKCITNLKVSEVSVESNEMWEHTFEKPCDELNFLGQGISENNYVVVSTDKRYAMAAGIVSKISSSSISVSLERNLNKKYKNQKFTIDTYDSSMIETFQFSSLALLLENTPKAENLRKIIIDKIPPTFKPTLPRIIGTKGKSILKRLNIVQQRAVLKAITANEYFLIKGMPGTGKTATIVALIQLLFELGNTVLITSHTNSAVDNVCLKLLEYDVKVLRLGSNSKINRDLWEYSEQTLTKDFNTPEEYKNLYEGAKILAITCIGSGHPLLSKRTFDFCIVDESTQVVQSSVIRPLYACKTFILLGDPDQLPAVVKNEKAKDLGMSESLFERLYRPEATIALNINYRMNKTITSVANCLTYNGELKIGNESIENATISANLEGIYNKNGWIYKVLDNSLENAVQFLDTGPVWNLPQETSWKLIKNYSSDSQIEENQKVNNINIHEAAVICKIIKALLKGGIDPENIGVIASYRHQVEQLSVILENYSIDVNTVDQFQGKDKSVIIYSCGISRDTSIFKSPGKHDILEDKRRLNVAITRAKHKLLIIGDVETLLVYSTFKKLLSFFENNVVKLSRYEDFLWESVLDLNLS